MEMSKSYSSKSEAIKVANELRSQGNQVKIYRRSGVYTQPGRGLVPFVEFQLYIVK